MLEPLISVIIPTYNRASQVGRAIQSALEQSYGNLMIHLIDDGSTDNTRELVKPFFKDRRFFYHYQKNRGQSAARNVGIAQAQGDMIAFLDSDNFWMPHKLNAQIAFLSRHPEHEIIYSDGYVIDAHNNRIPVRSTRRFSGHILNHLLQGNFISNNTAMVSKNCFNEMGTFDEDLRISEDYDLWLRFATRYKFLYHPERVACYSITGPRLSDNEGKVLAANHFILNRFFENFPNTCGQRVRKQAWAQYYRWRAGASKRSGTGKPWQDLVQAISITPFDMRNFRLIAKMILNR